jgi:PTH1 family peptidyl-tRNA hydrolase
MFLLVGLGNPGKKYQKTRHNIGFRVIAELKSLNLKGVILAKPGTYMNQSGQAVKKLIKNYKLKIKNLIIIHDDIDLPLGKIRIIKNRGAAGHKGVESIIKELKTKDFVRFRIGIQPKTGKPKNPEKFVLQKFNKEEEKIVREVIKKTATAIELSLGEGLEKAMQKYNK